METKTIRIKYFTDKIDRLAYIGGKSDWIDLRCAKEVQMKAGEFRLIPLGVAMQLPEGFEAHVVPRSSTFKISALSRQTTPALSTRATAAITTSGLCRLMPCATQRSM